MLRLAQVTQEMAHLLGEEAGLLEQGPGQLLAPEFVADTKLVQRISPAVSPAVFPAVSAYDTWMSPGCSSSAVLPRAAAAAV